MLASGPAVLSALLVMQGPAELEAGARIDTRVGELPTFVAGTTTASATTSEQKVVLASATPLLGLRWTGEASELNALSATRILWRPVPQLATRPLFLETLETSLVDRPSQRSRFQLSLRGSYGEEDYTSLVQQFANQPALPTARTLLTLTAGGEGSWSESRRKSLTLVIVALHRRTPDTQSVTDVVAPFNTITVPALPTQTLVTVTPGLRYALDRRTRVEVLLGASETDIQGVQMASSSDARFNVLTLQPQLGVIEDLSRRHRLRAFAGLTYAAMLVNPDKSRDWHAWTPLARAELSSLLWRTRASAVRSTFSAATAWFADPVLGAAVQRGMVEASLDAELGLRWRASTRVSFITDLNSPLGPATTGGISPDETIAQLEVPVRYRWSSQLEIEFGARFAERGPNLAAADFSWRNREVWAYATLLTTTRQTPTREQAQPRSSVTRPGSFESQPRSVPAQPRS